MRILAIIAITLLSACNHDYAGHQNGYQIMDHHNDDDDRDNGHSVSASDAPVPSTPGEVVNATVRPEPAFAP